MKTYKARVAVTGTFYVTQTVEAKNLVEARKKFSEGEGENEDSSYDWDTWSEEVFKVCGRVVKEVVE